MAKHELIESVSHLVRTMVKELGMDFETALNSLLGIPEDLKQAVREQYDGEPMGLTTAKSAISRYYWERLRSFLTTQNNTPQNFILGVDSTSNTVTRALLSGQKTGLIIGQPQSGRTVLFSGIVAKAADAGYRFFLVLLPDLKMFEEQTKMQFGELLIGQTGGTSAGVGRPQPNREWLLYVVSSSGLSNHTLPQSIANGTRPILLIVRKNATLLRNLLDWLKNLPDSVKTDLPGLILDSEGEMTFDQQEVQSPEAVSPSLTQGLMTQVRTCLERMAYVAYTDSLVALNKGLEKRYSFVLRVPASEGYLGPEFFRREKRLGEQGFGIFRTIPDADLETLAMLTHNESLSVPSSLRCALDDFILAGAVRRARGSRMPTTIAVHVDGIVATKRFTTQLLWDEFERARDDWRYSAEERRLLILRLRDRYENAFWGAARKVRRNFTTLIPLLGSFIESVVISSGEDRPLRDTHQGQVIVPTARELAGLSHKGLVISYFAGKRCTDQQFSTLFGYRLPDADLIRVYLNDAHSRYLDDLLANQ